MSYSLSRYVMCRCPLLNGFERTDDKEHYGAGQRSVHMPCWCLCGRNLWRETHRCCCSQLVVNNDLSVSRCWCRLKRRRWNDFLFVRHAYPFLCYFLPSSSRLFSLSVFPLSPPFPSPSCRSRSPTPPPLSWSPARGSGAEAQLKANLVRFSFKICHMVAGSASVYNMQLRNIGMAKCIVCHTCPTVDRATTLLSHYVPAPLYWKELVGELRPVLIDL